MTHRFHLRGSCSVWLVGLLAATGCLAEAAESSDTAAAPAPGEPEPTADPEIEASPSEEQEVVEVPSTTMPLALLATLAGAKERARATIRNASNGVIASYRIGDAIDGARVEAIEPGYVLLAIDGRLERLDVGVDPVTLRADDVFYPDLAEDEDLSGSMADAIQMTEGPGYMVKQPALAWGTPRAVAALREGLRDYAEREPDAPLVHVGHLSKREGGPFPPHLSHQSGRDVDIGYVLQGPLAHHERFVRADVHNFDARRSWNLLESLLATGEVAYVFADYDLQRELYEFAADSGIDSAYLDDLFQYPRGAHASHGVIRHWKGHENHFHVRFKR